MNGSRLVAAVILALALSARPAGADEQGARAAMPASWEKIANVLFQRGVVPPGANAQQVDTAVAAYLRSKAGAEKAGNRLARKQLDANEDALNAASAGGVRGRKLGTGAYVSPSKPQFKPIGSEGKLLLMLVDFADAPFTWQRADGSTKTARGPLHDQIARPDNDYDLWMSNFDVQHYENMLFTPGGWTIPEGKYAGQRRGSMHDYYLAQSYGKYTVNGSAYGWFTVPRPEAYYGDDDPTGDDLLPGTTWDLIRDAVTVANAQGAIPWAQYDTDGDCVLDHVLVIHAGADQSAGGGAQGDDAIWAHSWDIMPKLRVAAGSGNTCSEGYFISNYTIMPEDGSIGVFAHEFGHDLGLPDEYDTIYSGRGDSIANWSIMSQGSWAGVPAQTEPTNMSVWARYALGWTVPGDNLGVVQFRDLTKAGSAFRLEQAGFWGGAGTLNGLRVNVPPKRTVLATPHAGAQLFWGGRADLADATLARTVDLTGKTSAQLSFWTTYDIEPGWDFAFVQVSTDGGATFTSLPVAGTTSQHDADAMGEIVANLPGFTGKSGGWVQKSVDLSAFAGKQLRLQLRYMTDWGTNGGGFFVDDVAVVADGATVFADGAETIDPAWALAGGFVRSDGSQTFAQYYMVELRNSGSFSVPAAGAPISNFDFGLNHLTQYDPYGSTGNPNMPWLYPYSPGVVVWFRDTTYALADNWTGAHPGHGFLLVVDAHDSPILRPSAGSTVPGWGSYPFNTHVQSSDAAFSLDRALDFTLGYFGATRNYSGLNAVPSFDDGLRYWNQQTPDASTLLPTNGLLLRVVGQATDGSAASVAVGLK